MSAIQIVDTTIRDANQSVWGERMTTRMMFDIAPAMNRAGFHAIDATAMSHFEYAVRYLRENPFARMKRLAQLITSAPLSKMMVGTTLNIFRYVGGPIFETWLERLVANGVSRVQFMESSNNMEDMVENCASARKLGLQVVIPLVYTHSEIHTDEYYAEKTRDAVKLLKPDIVYLKDPGGLITPERTKTIIPAIQKNLNGTPLEFHTHCTTGLGLNCYLEALKLGVRTFHTASRPLANGPSQPATESFLHNASHLGHESDLDGGALEEMARHFAYIAETEGLPMGRPVEYDEFQFQHQCPGGVISNLKRQLEQLGALDKLDRVLHEAVAVRRDLGYPIMVTPLSQFVVTQATINILQGERYRVIADEVIRFALGHYGKQLRPVDPELMDRMDNLPRTKDLAKWERTPTSIDDIRKQVGASYSDEELLLLVLVQEDDIKAMREAAPKPTEFTRGNSPLATYLRRVLKSPNVRQFSVNRDGVRMEVRVRS